MVTHPVFNQRLIARSSVLTACALAALFLVQCSGGGGPAIFFMEPLPYSQGALAPPLSAETIGFHYQKN